MAEPIAYRILTSLQNILLGIKTSAGYHFTAAAGAVSITTGDATETMLGATTHSPFFFLESAPTGRPVYQPASQEIETLLFIVWAAANAEQLAPGSGQQTYMRLYADVEKAIAKDEAARTHGGLATETRIVGSQPWFGGGTPRVVAIIQIEVRVYREFGKPNG